MDKCRRIRTQLSGAVDARHATRDTTDLPLCQTERNVTMTMPEGHAILDCGARPLWSGGGLSTAKKRLLWSEGGLSTTKTRPLWSEGGLSTTKKETAVVRRRAEQNQKRDCCG